MKTVTEMAKEAGDDWESTLSTDREFLARFAEIVRADAIAEEREACAKVCEAHAPTTTPTYVSYAAAIRARSKT